MSALQQILLAAAPRLTIWNAADKSASVTLNTTFLVATATAVSTRVGVRSTSSKGAGQWHVELMPTGGGNAVPGLAPAGASLSQFPGQAAGSGIGLINDGRVFVNSSLIATIETWSSGTPISFEYDATASTVYIQVFGGLRRGPYSLGAIGDCFVFGSVFTTGDTQTLNAGQSAFSISPTAGYGPWTA